MSDFSIDNFEPTLYEKLGFDKIVELSTSFYNMVYEDKEPSFRSMFPEDKDMAIQHQYEFFVQRFGGPPLYSQRKGHPALRARHAHFQITRHHAGRWLGYMRKAMEKVGIPEPERGAMDQFFADVAYFLQNVDDSGNRIY